jgi:NAD+ synthetase
MNYSNKLPEIDSANFGIVKKLLLGFIKEEVGRAGLNSVVLGLSGGVDSAAVCYLAAGALGPKNVTAVLMPYKTSSPKSLEDALSVVKALGINHLIIDITKQLENYFSQIAASGVSGNFNYSSNLDSLSYSNDVNKLFKQKNPAKIKKGSNGGSASTDLSNSGVSSNLDGISEGNEYQLKIRMGNKMARERMSILYDLSYKLNSLVLGTSNKSELLLGYGTIYGDMASALNPIGDIYKTQIYQLANLLGVPKNLIEKAPSADLWIDQSDEKELGFTYKLADNIMFLLVDKMYKPDVIESLGYDINIVNNIYSKIKRSQYKRSMPLIAKVSQRTINVDFRYLRDWV